jgi:ATP-binding cassette subfamily F protein 3
VYPGGFKDFDHEMRRRAGGEAAQARDRREASRKSAPPPDKPDKSDKTDKDAKQKYEAQRQAARDLEKKKRRIQELETSIAAGEKDLDLLRGKLKQGPADDWEKLAKMAQEEQVLTRKVDAMLMEWAKLSEETK